MTAIMVDVSATKSVSIISIKSSIIPLTAVLRIAWLRRSFATKCGIFLACGD